MTDHVLTLNAGSSSVKFALYPAGLSRRRAAALGDRRRPGHRAPGCACRAPGARCSADGALAGAGGAAASHDDALRATWPCCASMPRTCAWPRWGTASSTAASSSTTRCAIDDARARATSRRSSPWRPLHQPHNLAGVRAARHAFPDVPQVACFDTAFHRAQPEVDPALRPAARAARRGRAPLRLPRPFLRVDLRAARGARARGAGRVVVAHLGHGASMCAIRDGRSVATTMSFSPLDGLPMGTRCGRLDAAVVLYLLSSAHGARAHRAPALPRVRPAGAVGHHRRDARARGLDGARGARGGRLLRRARLPRARRDVRGAGRDGPPRVHRGHRRERRRGPRAHRRPPAWMGLALDEAPNESGGELVSAPGSAAGDPRPATDEEAAIARQAARFVSGKRGKRSTSSLPSSSLFTRRARRRAAAR